MRIGTKINFLRFRYFGLVTNWRFRNWDYILVLDLSQFSFCKIKTVHNQEDDLENMISFFFMENNVFWRLKNEWVFRKSKSRFRKKDFMKSVSTEEDINKER